MVAFDYSQLRGLIREKEYTQEKLASEAHMSITQLNGKLQGKYPFKQKDIHNISTVLGIVPTDIGRYFFTTRVAKTQR